MENISEALQQFICPIHNNETFQRVSIDFTADKMFYCIDCLMGCEKSLRNTLVDLDTFIQNISEGFSKIKPFKFNANIPEELRSLDEKKEENFKLMSDHISLEKEKIAASLKIIQND